MLAKRHRLNRATFSHYFKTGIRQQAADLTLIYTPLDQFHGAVVVGKKVSRRAVDRNQLRRRAYHALYDVVRPTGQTGVYIIITKPSAKQRSYSELKAQLTALLSQVQ